MAPLWGFMAAEVFMRVSPWRSSIQLCKARTDYTVRLQSLAGTEARLLSGSGGSWGGSSAPMASPPSRTRRLVNLHLDLPGGWAADGDVTTARRIWPHIPC